MALTAIVAALAISAYRTFSIRSQVSAGVALATPLRTAIVATFKRYGGLPAEGLPSVPADVAPHLAGSYVSGLAVVNGRIDVTYGDRADPAISGRRLSLTPYEAADLEVVWICGNEIPPRGLMPLGFAGGGPQAVQIPTTIEARYLLAGCR
jgi:type IV pilus assembly protein PilA